MSLNFANEMGCAQHVDELFVFSDWRFWTKLTSFDPIGPYFDHVIDPMDAMYLMPFERYK